MEGLQSASAKQVPVQRVNGSVSSLFSDLLSVEEPLEISISYGPLAMREQKNISVTMRTPGNDRELAAGFLFTEGIIGSRRDIEDPDQEGMERSLPGQHIIQVALNENCIPQLQQSDRNFYTTSSCGVCGKSSIQSIKTVSPFSKSDRSYLTLVPDTLYQLPGKLRAAQSGFAATGGIHASGLFTIDGELLLLREDVGRHNALDKLIGSALISDLLPLSQHILLLSGRASFELIQKAAMAGIAVVAAIGAPSSLAVDLAKEFDITLLGFLKESRFNIYHLSERVKMPVAEEVSNR
ncbi:formate dehydrogenase accessory sulfurtransferase FdhD [Niabella soli]|uniref:Sulfur carrier protein FdhD n=1 Tax=Niabella soli DSM 19437 TaxID=929713 RepID=W0EZZ1_9BACT|nr:formate dehydrogenase accessory sulfurtransferase FdhD [Niabella soli]AHF16322.1 formate dehydrogenase [Niabella soli DSM 19437]